MTKAETIKNAMTVKDGSLLGSIVTWSMRGVRMLDVELKEVTDRHGIDEVKRTWRLAYSIAMRQMSKDDDTLTFTALNGSEDRMLVVQVDRIRRTEIDGLKDAVEHEFQSFLEIDHIFGSVSSRDNKDPALADKLWKSAAEWYHARTTRDVRKALLAIFMGVDLVPLRDCGGVYFVFAESIDVVDFAARFMADVGTVIGQQVGDIADQTGFDFNRFDVTDNDDTRTSVRQKWVGFVNGMIDDLNGKVDDLDVDNCQAATLVKWIESVRGLKAKVESHADLMADAASVLNAKLVAVADAIAKKLEAKEAA